MTPSRRRALLWGPRVLALLVCANLASFSLDAFTGGEDAGQLFLGFEVHLIPVFALLFAVVVAWRWEWVGALVFTCCALWYAVVARAHLSWVALTSVPLLLVAMAYLLAWKHHDELHAVRD